MALRPIVEYPDKRLKMVSERVTEFNDELKTLAADMAETMYAAPGIGLAAIQIGVPLRVVTVDVAQRESEGKEDEPPVVTHKLLTLVNPEVISKTGEQLGEEGCLSVPGVFEDVMRARRVEVRYQDLQGESHVIAAEGLLAICLQHEIDHTNGVIFLQHLSPLKRKFAGRRCERFKLDREEKANAR